MLIVEDQDRVIDQEAEEVSHSRAEIRLCGDQHLRRGHLGPLDADRDVGLSSHDSPDGYRHNRCWRPSLRYLPGWPSLKTSNGMLCPHPYPRRPLATLVFYRISCKSPRNAVFARSEHYRVVISLPRIVETGGICELLITTGSQPTKGWRQLKKFDGWCTGTCQPKVSRAQPSVFTTPQLRQLASRAPKTGIDALYRQRRSARGRPRRQVGHRAPTIHSTAAPHSVGRCAGAWRRFSDQNR